MFFWCLGKAVFRDSGISWDIFTYGFPEYLTYSFVIIFRLSFLVRFKTNLCLASHKRDIGKPCRLRSDAAERGVWSGSTLFALKAGISVTHGSNKN